ncbi:hypothetical protein ACQ4PT_030273 [Festuca glaucescens]
MSPYMSRSANGLFGNYCPVVSRAGLVLLRRRHASSKLDNLCVYDPITGRRTFLSNPPPPGIRPYQTRCFDRCVLLTAAVGIGCSFLLFMPYMVTMVDSSSNISRQLQTATYTCGTGTSAPAAVTSHTNNGFFSQYCRAIIRRGAIVLQGGAIHWLMRHRGEIAFYNVCTTEHGTMKLPDAVAGFRRWLHLGSYYSHDRQKAANLVGCSQVQDISVASTPGRRLGAGRGGDRHGGEAAIVAGT